MNWESNYFSLFSRISWSGLSFLTLCWGDPFFTLSKSVIKIIVLEIPHINSGSLSHLLQYLFFHATLLYISFWSCFVFFSNCFMSTYNTQVHIILTQVICSALLVFCFPYYGGIIHIDYPMMSFQGRNHFNEMFFIWLTVGKRFFFILLNLPGGEFFCTWLKHKLLFWLSVWSFVLPVNEMHLYYPWVTLSF